jgi:hypothetical protein
MLEWQPLTWHVFHTIALNYNEEYKDEYIKFFHTFKTIIPCKICKEHYIKHITSSPDMYIENNINEDRFFKWTVDLHNAVNKMNHISQWSYEKALEHYKVNNFNNQAFKLFILEYVKNNFKKNPIKTDELLNMMKTLAYFHPNGDKRNKLIDFTNKFSLNRKSLRQWLIAFIFILKSK